MDRVRGLKTQLNRSCFERTARFSIVETPPFIFRGFTRFAVRPRFGVAIG